MFRFDPLSAPPLRITGLNPRELNALRTYLARQGVAAADLAGCRADFVFEITGTETSPDVFTVCLAQAHRDTDDQIFTSLGVAKRSPADAFNPQIGRLISLSRALRSLRQQWVLKPLFTGFPSDLDLGKADLFAVLELLD